ncbi:MAG: hypothetical protein ACREN2_08380 [Candidatus Dormibacteria bacterium]
MTGDPWFVRRRFGYGWRPYAWQGIVITAVLIAAAAITAVLSRVNRAPLGLLVIAMITVIYLVIGQLTAGPAPNDRPSDGGPD